MNINKIIADVVFLYPQSEIGKLLHKEKEFSKFSILLIQNFSSQQKYLGSVGLQQTNNYLKMA